MTIKVGEETYYSEDYVKKLQEENERYKKIFEGKEKFSKIMPEGTDFIILSKTDYDRQQEDIELNAIELKSKIDKAIEYTKQFVNGKTSRIDEWKNVELVLETILDILQGVDKE